MKKLILIPLLVLTGCLNPTEVPCLTKGEVGQITAMELRSPDTNFRNTQIRIWDGKTSRVCSGYGDFTKTLSVGDRITGYDNENSTRQAWTRDR